MSNKFKDISILLFWYFSDNIINIKKFDPSNIKIHKKSYKNILIYYIGYVTIKDAKYLKIHRLNPLYLIINKVQGYFVEINKSEYLTLVPTNESKQKIKKYEELWNKIWDLITSITKNLDDYDEKYVKFWWQVTSKSNDRNF